MTREEAIAVLQTIRPIPHRGDGKSTTHALEIIALDMAINALQQEPCEDAISRAEVLKKAVHTETEDGWSGYTVSVEDIKNLSSVQPKPKTGHWIVGDGNREVYAMEYECSVCGCNVIGGGDFCKWCGARMFEPQESEDKCEKCEYYINPDYTRCHTCKAESEDKE